MAAKHMPSIFETSLSIDFVTISEQTRMNLTRYTVDTVGRRNAQSCANKSLRKLQVEEVAIKSIALAQASSHLISHKFRFKPQLQKVHVVNE